MTAKVADARSHPGTTALVPYLPRLVVDWYAKTPGERYREVEGTVAFVDISGFTRLSERLARQGKVGAEELADKINDCFTQLLAVAYAEGGNLLKFGGDALLLLFTGDRHAGRACGAAVGMRRTLRSIGRMRVLNRNVTLRMSVGIHSGTFHVFLVGESHREFVIAGPAATTTVLMESTAEAGEILVSGDTAARIGPGMAGSAKGPGRLLLRAPQDPSAASTGAPVVRSEVDLSPCLPVAIRQSLLAGVHEAEHRRATIAFLRFEEFDQVIRDHGSAEAANRLEALIGSVQRAADRRGVAFLATDVDRDGGKIILAAGAPSASGEDERRMLLALRDVLDDGPALPLRIGVNRGDVFAGDIGPFYRRTYTVMGDTVNLAARVMSKASQGQLLATEKVVGRAVGEFETSEVEPFHVKGKAQAVVAFAVGPRSRVRQASSDQVPLIGRENELQTMLVAVESARRGEGRCIELAGEAGVGKSRLIEELRRRADGMVQLSAACDSYESSTPYFAFRQLLRDLLGLNLGADDSEAQDQLHARLGIVAPALVPWAPLVAAVVNVQMQDTSETAQLEDRFRQTRLAEVVRELLTALLPSPTVLIVEDAHWMDSASRDLLRHLAGAVGSSPWLICVSTREGGIVAAEEGSVHIGLQPLRPAEAAAFINTASSDSPLPPHAIAALAERSGGNPLFLRELVTSARAVADSQELPDTVEALISSRIDRLSPHDRNLLRRASVLGRSFPRRLLGAVLEDPPSRGADVWSRLAGFLRAEGRDTVAFEHALVRDSAYEGLPYRLRRQLHGNVAEWLRASAQDKSDDVAALLSLHYLHAQRFPEAWQYALVAAERARTIYANVEAAELYERALEAARALPAVGSSEVARVQEALGDMRNRIGGYASAERAFRIARRLAPPDPVDQARLLLKLSWAQGWLKRYANARRVIRRGVRTLEGQSGEGAARQRAELLAWYGHFCQDEGRHARAIKWCRLAIEEAEAAGADEALAHALRILGWANMDLGRLDGAAYLSRALALFERLGDLPGQASVLNMLGGDAYFRGDWDRALELYDRVRDALERTGNTVMLGFCVSNIGEITLDQGRLDEARRLFEECSRISRAVGYRAGVAYATCNLARVASRQGDHAEAARLFNESLAESHAIGAQQLTLETSARLAEGQLLAGKMPAALATADEALARAHALGGIAAQRPLLLRVRGAALMCSGDLAAARVALDESLAAARDRNATYEAALTLEVLAELERRLNRTAEAEARRRESGAVFTRLGVISPPELVGAPGGSTRRTDPLPAG